MLTIVLYGRPMFSSYALPLVARKNYRVYFKRKPPFLTVRQKKNCRLDVNMVCLRDYICKEAWCELAVKITTRKNQRVTVLIRKLLLIEVMKSVLKFKKYVVLLVI
jgi:hypothetical protein